MKAITVLPKTNLKGDHIPKPETYWMKTIITKEQSEILRSHIWAKTSLNNVNIYCFAIDLTRQGFILPSRLFVLRFIEFLLVEDNVNPLSK
jgi:hypothetical protein